MNDDVKISNLQSMMQFVFSNYDYIDKSLLRAIKEKRADLLANEESLLHDEIERQFNDRAKWVVASDMAARSSIPIDEVLSFVETLNMKEFLK